MISELETAKQILAVHTKHSEVEEMIQRRLEEKSWNQESWQEEEEPWPREFCLSE